MKTAYYAGSFDPITRGHFNVIEQALGVFDHVIVAIGVNPNKKPLFPVETSLDLINQAIRIRGLDEVVTAKLFEGALVRAAEAEGAAAIVRGLRQVSDFGDEFTQNGVNSRATNLPLVYFICKQEFLHVSSSTAKLMASLDMDTSWLVDPPIEEALKQQYAKTA
jgi:pantetheine-phosphate adenylyltransferase